MRSLAPELQAGPLCGKNRAVQHPSNLNSLRLDSPKRFVGGKREEIHLSQRRKVQTQTEHCTQGHTEREQNWEQNPRLLLPKPQTFHLVSQMVSQPVAILGWLPHTGDRSGQAFRPRLLSIPGSLVNNQWRGPVRLQVPEGAAQAWLCSCFPRRESKDASHSLSFSSPEKKIRK